MIIKSIYIESFGGLVNKSFDFDSGLNIIYGENEYGKSTIAEFIKIMLYGFGRAPQNIRDNERVKFMTWGKEKIGGQMTILKDNREYILRRTFGKRKSEDTISIISALTGVKEHNFTSEVPGEFFLGINRATFENTLYIKQLSTKMNFGSDDEILSHLINLAQSGDDDISYQSAIQILDKTAKEIEGNRPKGKIPLIQDEINQLYSALSIEKNKELHISNLKKQLHSLEEKKLQLEKFQPNNMEYDSLLASTLSLNKTDKVNRIGKGISLSFALASLFIFKGFPIPSILLFVLCISFFIYLSVKNKRTTKDTLNDLEELKAKQYKKIVENKENSMEIIKEITKIQYELENHKSLSLYEIEAKIEQLENQVQEYKKKLDDIKLAKMCIERAFKELQRNFTPRLNSITSNIIGQVSNGMYNQVLVSHDYSIKLRDKNGVFQDGQYLSCGAFDQIYFSLRMAIIELLLPDAPIILDEAFAHYDNNRLKSSLDYLKTLKNHQIFLFTCHTREHEYIKRTE